MQLNLTGSLLWNSPALFPCFHRRGPAWRNRNKKARRSITQHLCCKRTGLESLSLSMLRMCVRLLCILGNFFFVWTHQRDPTAEGTALVRGLRLPNERFGWGSNEARGKKLPHPAAWRETTVSRLSYLRRERCCLKRATQAKNAFRCLKIKNPKRERLFSITLLNAVVSSGGNFAMRGNEKFRPRQLQKDFVSWLVRWISHRGKFWNFAVQWIDCALLDKRRKAFSAPWNYWWKICVRQKEIIVIALSEIEFAWLCLEKMHFVKWFLIQQLTKGSGKSIYENRTNVPTNQVFVLHPVNSAPQRRSPWDA